MASAQLKNSFYGIGEVEANMHPSTLALKLSITKKVCRYFVFSQTNKEIIFLGEYTLHHVSDEQELAQRLERIVSKDEILQLPFSKIFIGLDEPYSLFPTDMADQMVAENTNIQRCKEISMAFHVEPDMSNTLQRLFAWPKLCHLNSTFLTETEFTQNRLLVNISSEYFEVIYRDGKGNLILMNRYNYSAATDFIYFLLLCCKELNINREVQKLVLAGEVENPSRIYDLCYRYFSQIEFAVPPADIRFSDAFEQYPKHLHYQLYNLRG